MLNNLFTNICHHAKGRHPCGQRPSVFNHFCV